VKSWCEASTLRRRDPPLGPRRRVSAMTFGGLSALGQIHLSVSDIDRAVAFYRDTLGVPFLFRVPGQPMAFFDLEGVRLYLGVPESEAFRSQGMLYFRVEDLDVAVSALRERGVDFLDDPHLIARMDDHDLWMAFFRDPDGNNLALMEERRPAG
jgi:catechol 2,3-dioxygenase-like lactoylglutathione lyase family enzyme